MAEDEPTWRSRHAHETNYITYGVFGTASYNKGTQDWSFLREIESDHDVQTRPLLKTLTGPELVVEGQVQDLAARHSALFDRRLFKRVPELAPAQASIETVLRDDRQSHRDHPDTFLDFGSAVWLGADRQDRRNQSVPVTVYTTGPDRDTLRISCVGSDTLDYTSEDRIQLSLKVPSLTSDTRAIWQGKQSIQQVVFSERKTDGLGDTFLAVRQRGQTNLFEPLLRHDASGDTTSRKSSLDSNLLLTLGRSVTGGQDHAHICFHPHDHRKLAIVDVEGNWSIWKIRGRRSTTARKLYQARLEVSGKIFSWAHKRRPEGVGLYFDGWHKVIWTSSNGTDIDRILVCNRQHVKLFDLNGEVVCWVDIRLDTHQFEAHIDDVQLGPKINICYVLTTSSLLVFNFAKQDWKDVGKSRGPALLCSLQHLLNGNDLRLITVDLAYDEVLIGLHSKFSKTIKLYRLRFTFDKGAASVRVCMEAPFELPPDAIQDSALSLKLIAMETNQEDIKLLRLILQFGDLSVRVMTLELLKSSPAGTPLRLPPGRGGYRKSERYVDEMDDEKDLTSFIVPDTVANADAGVEQDDAERTPGDVGISLPAAIPHHSASDTIRCAIESLIIGAQDPSQRRDIQSALDALAQNLEDQTPKPRVDLVSDLFDKHCRIEDIETDSSTLERGMQMISSQVKDKIDMSTWDSTSFQSFSETYNHLLDQYVISLDSSIPDRVRVSRERQARDIALDIYLSNRTVRPVAPSSTPQASQTAAPMESDSVIFSDPLAQPDYSSPPPTNVPSASQPTLPARLTVSSEHSALCSALPDILVRLNTYTTITTPPTSLVNEPQTAKHLTSILSHLPASITDPATYDFQAAELNAAALTGDTRLAPHDVSTTKASRRAERLARARRRADEISLPVMPNVRVEGAKQEGPSYPTFVSGAETHREASDDLGGVRLGEGNEPVPSQVGPGNFVAATQPERGVFGARAGLGMGKSLKLKKKKRVAGF